MAYDVRLVSFADLNQDEHRSFNPFGQIPTFEQHDVALFESGAILLHIADHHPGLWPVGETGRARAISWIFAVVNTVEPPILELATARLLEGDRPWTPQRIPLIEARIRERLDVVAAHMNTRTWIMDTFSIADIMMVHGLVRLKPTDILGAYPSLIGYCERAEARPAYQRAFAAQLAVYQASLAAT